MCCTFWNRKKNLVCSTEILIKKPVVLLMCRSVGCCGSLSCQPTAVVLSCTLLDASSRSARSNCQRQLLYILSVIASNRSTAYLQYSRNSKSDPLPTSPQTYPPPPPNPIRHIDCPPLLPWISDLI